jgi:hypothetical protein
MRTPARRRAACSRGIAHAQWSKVPPGLPFVEVLGGTVDCRILLWVFSDHYYHSSPKEARERPPTLEGDPDLITLCGERSVRRVPRASRGACRYDSPPHQMARSPDIALLAVKTLAGVFDNLPANKRVLLEEPALATWMVRTALNAGVALVADRQFMPGLNLLESAIGLDEHARAKHDAERARRRWRLLRVSTPVALGLTNAQIGERMYLSRLSTSTSARSSGISASTPDSSWHSWKLGIGRPGRMGEPRPITVLPVRAE